ncbi:MAG: hypothetical protein EOP04_20435, partial [Proteobacteria bacterium]
MKDNVLAMVMCFIFMAACQENKAKLPHGVAKVAGLIKRSRGTIRMLPLGNVPKGELALLQSKLQAICGNVILMPGEKIPAFAWYAPRARYRADSLISWMAQRADGDDIYLGVTKSDISTTKNHIP